MHVCACACVLCVCACVHVLFVCMCAVHVSAMFVGVSVLYLCICVRAVLVFVARWRSELVDSQLLPTFLYRDSDSLGPSVCDRVSLRLHHLHGLLLCGLPSPRRCS